MEVINRLLGLVVGLALLAGGFIVLVETTLAAAGRPGWLIDRDQWVEVAEGLQWEDQTVVVVAAILAVVGLVLALLQVWPMRPRFLPLQPHGPDRRDAIDGRGLQSLLRGAAAEDQDVLVASATVKRRNAKVAVSAPPDVDRGAVRGRVEDKVGGCIDALGLERSIKPDVTVNRSGTRVR